MSDMTDRLNAALEGRYRIDRELGAGGMATVYLAEDLKHDRNVALKVLKPELAAVVGAERFLAEIKTTAQLQHPHILPLHDSGEADSFLFYVMPYVEGESLREKLERERQLPVEDAVRIAKAVANGLDYAHRQGVVHRDIKPANILLQDGEPVIADFGIALAVQQAGGGRLTETGLSLGTPYYMSPEQATADRDPDARSDVYSLGCVLYEMLTGDPPFQGTTAQAVLGRILTGAVQPPTELRRSIPAHVEAVVLKALERLPADRLGSAADFAAAVSDPGRAAALVGTPGRRDGPSVSMPVAAMLGALVLVLGALAAFGWLRPAPAEKVSRYTLEFADQASFAPAWYPVDILPDGSGVVFQGEVDGTRSLWYRPLDSLEFRRINGTESALNPAVSPRGDQVAFMDQATRSIKVVSLTGGAVATVTDSLVDQGGVAWGEDGYIYFDGHLEGDGIARVLEGGGTPEVVTSTSYQEGERWHNDPHPLPGGRGVLFTVARGDIITARDFQIAVTAGPGEPHRVVVDGAQNPRYSSTGHLLFVRQGDLMAAPFDLGRLEVTGPPVPLLGGVPTAGWGRGGLALSMDGTLVYSSGPLYAASTRLLWIDRAGDTTPVDSEVAGPLGQAALSPDGRSAALSVAESDGNHIWRVDLETGNARKLTFEGHSLDPFWTSDGEEILFVARVGLTWSLMRVPADGRTLSQSVFVSEPDHGSEATTRIHDPAFGPTGHILYETTAPGDPTRTYLAMRFPDPDSVQIPLVQGVASYTDPRTSPDGRWLAFASDETGRWEVYVRPFPEVQRAKALVSRGGGVNPRWSDDGSEIFYTSIQDDLMTVPVEVGERFTAGPPRRLFSRASLNTAPQADFEPHPDGDRFLMIDASQSGSEARLVVVEGLHRMILEATR